MFDEKFRIEIPWPLTPVKFHPYRSVVLCRILETNFCEATEILRKDLIDMFNEAGIKCHNDNKIVFELDFEGTKVYYGFYDLKFSIGLRYQDDNER